jgi:hypothetical protein
MDKINRLTTFFIFIFILIQFTAFAGQGEFIEPTTDFSLNFLNFPQAWQVSRGANVKISIVYEPTKAEIDWKSIIQRTAPDSEVNYISKSAFLSSSSAEVPSNIILILEPIDASEYEIALKAIQAYTEKGTAIILPAYFESMQRDYDYSPWQRFVRQASEKGALIVGAHGDFFQLGDLNFWRAIPIDIFSLNHRIASYQYMNYDALINVPLEGSAYLVAGAVALMVSKNPGMSPIQIKRQLKEKGRKIKWFILEERKRAYPTWQGWVNDEIEDDIKNIENPQTFEGTCLDAGMVLGQEPLVEGQGCHHVLNVKKAQQIATGKGITVAILDWLFNKGAPSLKGRIVKPGSIVPDSVFDIVHKSGHGTWMANELVKVAPDVKIMPIRIHSFEKPDDFWDNQYTQNLIKGINYAIKNGADILTISSAPVPDGWLSKFDEAVQRASGAGLTIVYIHYYGERKDVVVTHPIEFAEKSKELVYVIGTGFIDESSFPLTWGVSQTAPIVGGVIAMMKELNPELKPAEIREILLKSGKAIEGGFQVLDAFKALQYIKSLE